MRKLPSAVLLVVSASLALSGCASTQATPENSAVASKFTGLLKQVADNGSIKIITTNSVPYSNVPVGSTGELQGIAPDVLRGFFDSVGLKNVKIEPSILAFPDSIPALQAGQADMLLDLFYITPERQKIIDFAKPIMMDPEALIVKAGNPLHLTDLISLCGKTVGVNKGTAYADLMEKENEKCPEAKKMTLTLYPNYQGQFSDVGIGRIDATIIDAPVAAAALKENPSLGFELVKGYKPSLSAPISVMFKKGTKGFVPEFDAYLTKIRKNGELEKIMEKWGMEPVDLFLAPESDY